MTAKNIKQTYKAMRANAWASVISVIAACSAEGAGTPGNQTAWQTGRNDGGISFTGVAIGAPCPTDNLTQGCTCQDTNGQTAAGRQVCSVATGWGNCACDLMPATLGDVSGTTGPMENKGPERFDWKRTIPTGGVCKAGYYEGTFSGEFNSEVLSNLTIGIYSSVPVSGDVKFNIQEKPGTSGEQFEISDGHFLGTAIQMFPFDGDFYGTLDCRTKTFTGGLKHCFYLVVEDKYAFQGIALSRYDVTTNTFIDGVWSVTEPSTGACYYSPVMEIDKPYPADSEFPPPLDIQPGTHVDAGPLTLPWEYRGGMGNWNGTFKNP